MNNKRLNDLINKNNTKQATSEEREELAYWYTVFKNRNSTNKLSKEEKAIKYKRIWDKTIHDPQLAPLLSNSKSLYKSPAFFWAAATVAIIFATIAYFSLFQYEKTISPSNFTSIKDIEPASQKAILVLSDGSTINLNELEEGKSIEQAGVSITKTPNGVITHSSLSKSTNESKINTIRTPRGGQYNLVLPDGTLVWLNAESSLSYPSTFSKSERRVNLTGEAYFEVVAKYSSNSKKISSEKTPFIVSTKEQEIEVLGTHFNVKSYTDEEQTTTTLLEGKVRVTGLNNNSKSTQGRILNVGEQAIWKNNKLNIAKVNINKAIDWKDGKFIFSGDNIKTIMTNISRWYNIDVSYQGDVSNINFEGSISRYETIGEVLRKLELTGTVQFKIVDAKNANDSERRIIVMP